MRLHQLTEDEYGDLDDNDAFDDPTLPAPEIVASYEFTQQGPTTASDKYVAVYVFEPPQGQLYIEFCVVSAAQPNNIIIRPGEPGYQVILYDTFIHMYGHQPRSLMDAVDGVADWVVTREYDQAEIPNDN